MYTRFTRTLAGTAVAVGLALSGATPASAEIVDRDRLLIDAPHADFGANSGGYSWGRPPSGAYVNWGDNSSHNESWLNVSGRLTIDAYWGGGCARAQANMRDADGTVVQVESRELCGGGFGSTPHTSMIFRSTDTRIESITICTTFNGGEKTCRTRRRHA